MRKIPRVSLELPVELTGSETILRGQIANLGINGAFIECGPPAYLTPTQKKAEKG
jgi:hypothetical protein